MRILDRTYCLINVLRSVFDVSGFEGRTTAVCVVIQALQPDLEIPIPYLVSFGISIADHHHISIVNTLVSAIQIPKHRQIGDRLRWPFLSPKT